jgi:predicted MFS family arabinose efflux permease
MLHTQSASGARALYEHHGIGGLMNVTIHPSGLLPLRSVAESSLWTGFGVGAFAGALTLTGLSRRWRPGIALPMIAVLWGALLCPLLFIRQIPLAMLFLGVAGASWAPYTPTETTLLQRLVPAEIRGQVFGARQSLVVAATPLGAACGGAMLQYLPAPVVIGISGLACILAGVGGLISPSLRRLQRGGS